MSNQSNFLTASNGSEQLLHGSRFLTIALSVGHAVLLVVPVVSVFFITVGHDEAWLLESIRNLVSDGSYASGAYLGPLTTGGLYAVVQSIIAAVLPHEVHFARFFSYFCWILLYVEVRRYARRKLVGSLPSLIASSAFFAVPGSMTLTAQAFGFLPALLLAIYAFRIWSESAALSPGLAVLVGLLLGLAAATRVNFLVLLPAIVLWSTVFERERRTILLSILASVVAVLFFYAASYLLSLFTPETQRLLVETVSDSGFGGSYFDYPGAFSNWQVLNDQLYIPFASAITVFTFGAERLRSRVDMSWKLLLVASWIMLIAFVLFSRIPHLRYIWPALFSFFVLGGLWLGDSHIRYSKSPRVWVRFGCVILAVALLFTTGVSALKQIAHGNADLLSFEWSRESESLPFRRFQHSQDQRRLAAFLNENVPIDTTVGVLFSSVTLRTLTEHRYIGPFDFRNGEFQSDSLPEFFVLDPLLGSYLFPESGSFYDFVASGDMVFQSGSYAVMRFTAETHDPESVFGSLTRGYRRPGWLNEAQRSQVPPDQTSR